MERKKGSHEEGIKFTVYPSRWGAPSHLNPVEYHLRLGDILGYRRVFFPLEFAEIETRGQEAPNKEMVDGEEHGFKIVIETGHYGTICIPPEQPTLQRRVLAFLAQLQERDLDAPEDRSPSRG